MSIAYRVLLRLSHRQDTEVTAGPTDNPLETIYRSYPDFPALIAGRRVLDFGCGHGHEAVAMARAGAGEVVGLDIQSEYIAFARTLGGDTPNVGFTTDLPPSGDFDVVLSQNSMEHFSDPAAVLREMAAHLRPGGVALVVFCPPWLAPYGHHMHYFLRVPWVHLFFPESAVMAARSHYRDDGATRYEEVTGGLNRMTLRKYERLVRESPLELERYRLIAVKGLPGVTRVPILRELLTNRVISLLRKPAPR